MPVMTGTPRVSGAGGVSGISVVSKKRILFVDDEPNVLHGLQRMLRPMRTFRCRRRWRCLLHCWIT